MEHEKVRDLLMDCRQCLVASKTKMEELEQWKQSAMAVLSEWDKVYVAAGRPGKLGESMALATVEEIISLRAKTTQI